MLTDSVDAPFRLRWKRVLHGFSRKIEAVLLAIEGIGVLGLGDEFHVLDNSTR